MRAAIVRRAAAIALVFGLACGTALAIPTPVSYWNFDNQVADQVGGNNGAMSGLTYSTSVPSAIGSGQSLYSNGANNMSNYVKIAANPSLVSTNWTLSYWVYNAGAGTSYADRMFQAFAPSGGPIPIDFSISGSAGPGALDTLTSVHIMPGDVWGWTGGGPAITPNTWQLQTYTYDGSTIQLYIDGSSTASWSHASSVNFTGANFNFFNQDPANNYNNTSLNGYMDDIGYWNTVLSSSDIALLHTDSIGDLLLPPPISEPVGLGLIGVALLALRKRRRS